MQLPELPELFEEDNLSDISEEPSPMINVL